MQFVDIYNRVRRARLKGGMSSREAAGYSNKDRKTIAKMLRHELSPGCPPRKSNIVVVFGNFELELFHWPS